MAASSGVYYNSHTRQYFQPITPEGIAKLREYNQNAQRIAIIAKPAIALTAFMLSVSITYIFDSNAAVKVAIAEFGATTLFLICYLIRLGLRQNSLMNWFQGVNVQNVPNAPPQ